MGYYTTYDISDNDAVVQDAIEKKSEYSFYSGIASEVKWYDWEDHCKEVSLMFPGTVITVEGDGEEQGDQWKAYFLDGKSQICKAIVTFEAFDLNNFK